MIDNKEVMRVYNPFEGNVANAQQVNNQAGKVMATDPGVAAWVEELLGTGEPVASTQKEEPVDNSRPEESEVQPEENIRQPEETEELTGELSGEVTGEVKDEKVERFMWMDKWYVGKPEPMSYEKLVELADDPTTIEIEDKIRLLDLEYPES